MGCTGTSKTEPKPERGAGKYEVFQWCKAAGVHGSPGVGLVLVGRPYGAGSELMDTPSSSAAGGIRHKGGCCHGVGRSGLAIRSPSADYGGAGAAGGAGVETLSSVPSNENAAAMVAPVPEIKKLRAEGKEKVGLREVR